MQTIDGSKREKKTEREKSLQVELIQRPAAVSTMSCGCAPSLDRGVYTFRSDFLIRQLLDANGLASAGVLVKHLVIVQSPTHIKTVCLRELLRQYSTIRSVEV